MQNLVRACAYQRVNNVSFPENFAYALNINTLLSLSLFLSLVFAFACKAQGFATALLFLFFPRRDFPGRSGNSEQKKYFIDHRKANTTQSVVAMKGGFDRD